MLNEIIYEILFFLDWRDYYNVIRKLDMPLKFNIYHKYNKSLINKSLINKSIDDICSEKREYLEVVKFLYSIDAPLTKVAMDWASDNGYLEVVKKP